MEDRLKLLFEEQLKLNLHINPKFNDICKSAEEIRKWVNNCCNAIDCENAELREGIGWKWYKALPEINEEVIHHAKVEVIDLLHFIIFAAQVLGMDDNEMWELYLAKNKLNHERQNKGYKEGTYAKVDDKGHEDNFHLKK